MAFVYKDQENHVSANLRSKTRYGSSIVNQKVENQISKRSVLGVINVDHAKVSTSRYKKQEVVKKVNCHVQKLNTFAVYEDVEENGDEFAEESQQEISPSKRFKDDLGSVLDLPPKQISADLQTRKPLIDVLDSSTASSNDKRSGKSFIESPMSIDKTISPVARPSTKWFKRKLFNCDVYSDEILSYLKKIESLHRPKPNYMMRQPDISYTMRTILVDWLVEVAQEYKLQSETLFLAVSFIDRFLSVMSVVKSKLQLLGTAAMFVASKYEEIYPPQVSDFVYITDDTYTSKQVLRMEYLILKVLAFDVSGPTPIAFVKHFSIRCNIAERVTHLATYLNELVLLEGDPYLSYNHSLIAASTILMARHLLDYPDLWPDHYVDVTGYQLEELSSCVEHLNRTHVNAKLLNVDAVNNKYSSDKFSNVASIKPNPLDLKEHILLVKAQKAYEESLISLYET